MFLKKHYIMIIIALLLSYSLGAANEFGLTSQQRILIETESFLRHSGYSTSITQYGSILKAKKDSSTLTIKIISLSSDSTSDQGVICYVTASDSSIFEKLSSDLKSFAALIGIHINVVRTQ